MAQPNSRMRGASRRRETLPAPKASKSAEARAAVRAPRWPVWVSLALTVLYVLLHVEMLSAALNAWGGLLSALVLGR